VRDLTMFVGTKDGDQRTLVLDHYPFTAGSRCDRDLAIGHPRISRQHAHFSREGDDVYIVDDGSRRGTLVNGDLVNRYMLKRGDKVEFGVLGVVWVLFDPESLP